MSRLNNIRALALLMLSLGAGSVLYGGIPPAPEIDGASAANVLCLLAGAALVIKARRR